MVATSSHVPPTSPPLKVALSICVSSDARAIIVPDDADVGKGLFARPSSPFDPSLKRNKYVLSLVFING